MRYIFLLFLLTNYGCQSVNTTNTALLKELSETEYPDHPYLDDKHALYDEIDLKEISFLRLEGSLFEITVLPTNSEDDTLKIISDLYEFIPTMPSYLEEDEYLQKICLVNQEWNRNQVRYDERQNLGKFQLAGMPISRIDLARNCLNSYLWELMLYTGEDEILLYQGWFDFPKKLYTQLYKDRNQEDFEHRAEYLENWIDPEMEVVNFDNFRTVVSSEQVNFEVRNGEMYPLQGERLLKRKEIVYPEHFETIDDLLTDSTTFATFSPPGIYDRSDPRKTELSRFKNLRSVAQKKTKTVGTEEVRNELELHFESENHGITRLFLGGLDFSEIPTLTVEEANSGQMYSMGLGNHPFYEVYTEHMDNSSKDNPYFGVLTNTDNEWLDSHYIGIDGPLFHFDEDRNLHLWLLSFERHALVGHVILSGLEN